MADANKGRSKSQLSNTSGTNVGRRGSFLSYFDNVASGKSYPQPSSRQMMKATETPFEPEVVSHLVGKKGNPEKARVTMTESVIQIPMKDEQNRGVQATGHFLHYRGPKGSALITPSGEVVTDKSQYMKKDMAPGMRRDKGEFVTYSIPSEAMKQPAEKFSYTKFDDQEK